MIWNFDSERSIGGGGNKRGGGVIVPKIVNKEKGINEEGVQVNNHITGINAEFEKSNKPIQKEGGIFARRGTKS